MTEEMADSRTIRQHLAWIARLLGFVLIVQLFSIVGADKAIPISVGGTVYDDGSLECRLELVGGMAVCQRGHWMSWDKEGVCRFRWAGTIPFGCFVASDPRSPP